MKASVYTLGCRVNQYESDAVAEMLAGVGFQIVPFGEECDITVINTCTVTAESDRKSRQLVRRAKKCSPNGYVIVTGCYAQIAKDRALEDGAFAVVGNGEKSRIADIALSMVNGGMGGLCVGDIMCAPYDELSVRVPKRARVYIKIEDGCENRCAYCIIPKARGAVRSRKMEDVLKEISAFAEKGVPEIILTGIETASYGKDLSDTDLGKLLDEAGKIKGIERIAMGSLEPTVIKKAFVEHLSKNRKILPHFHLSIQSGCTRTLNRMRRRYTAETALAAIEEVRECLPDATFSADIIVGFPGETREDFDATVEFCKKAQLLHLHIFPYSKREGTEAAEMPDQIPENEKKERAACLARIGEEIQDGILDKYIRDHSDEYSPVYVLCEKWENGVSNGHTEHFIECDIETEEGRVGEIIPVVIVGRRGSVLLGKAID
ncbi:MAG: tRNA (N(6)-L-threonylcarbamoyladenosine(37)-C(2))-methylthiotransferase MtaB [Ruminococcaceae bacterium]|nr:tRNA (N(6)-L-threonylcarbamoyladenosine(37)-C(2))-methylthiotransferase MtaB [Oscillospiraceae bacterium]